LLRAWLEAFDRNDDVELVIKATPNQHHHIDEEISALKLYQVPLIRTDAPIGAVQWT
jgi:uncharacterized protein involved in tolerance to divalent cations